MRQNYKVQLETASWDNVKQPGEQCNGPFPDLFQPVKR